MPKNKSKKRTFRPVPADLLLENPRNNPSSTCDTASSGIPSGTFKERKNDYKSGKKTSHVQDEEIAIIADSNLITSHVSEVASSDAMRGVPETVADEISPSSETISYSTRDLLPPKIERDVGYRNSSCDNNKIIHKNKGGKYRKQNDSNSASRKQQETEEKTLNESSFQDTTVNADSIQVDSKSTHPDHWNVDVIPIIAPDCSQLEEKVKRSLNRDAPEFKPKSHCSGLNYQAENIPIWNKAKESNISVHLESDYQERNATENEIFDPNQQNTVEDATIRDGNDNYHISKSNFGRRGRPAQSRQYVNSNRYGYPNEYPQEDCKSNYSDKNQRSQQNRSHNSRDRASESSGDRSKYSNSRGGKHPFEKRYSTSTHKDYGKLESPESDQNWDKGCTDAQPSHKANEDLQGAIHSASHFQNEATSNKNRWSQQNRSNNSRDGASEGSGNRSRQFNSRGGKHPFGKRDSTSTHKDHGKLESQESGQNWDEEWTDAQPSHKANEDLQGAMHLTSHFQNEATSNGQQGIESYSDKNRWSQQNRSNNSRDGASEGSGNRSRQFNSREGKHPFGKRDSTSTHQDHGKLESQESGQNWDEEWTEVKPSHKANEDLQGAIHSSSHFQNEATSNRQQGIESYSDKNRWSQQNRSNNSRDGASEGSGNRSRQFNSRGGKHPFGKRDSTSTHKDHGKLESPKSGQNWDGEWTEVKPSHRPHKSSKQGAIHLPSHFQNEATSNRQQDIESISKMNIRDADNYSAVKMKMDTSMQVLPKSRGLPDTRMQREAESKQQSNANWLENSSRKQRNPSPSPQNDDSEITENQNTTLQEDEDLEYDAWSDKMSKQRKSHPETKPKYETERKSLGGRIVMSSREDYDRSYEKIDVEYKEFNEIFRWNRKFDYVKVTEIVQDLFQLAKDCSYSLGHCVAEDLRMGSGIAVDFKSEFKQVPALLSQRQKQGGLAVLENNNRYIYYLVTKRVSTGKPTYETFWSSLKKMREHMVNHGVQKLAIPKIGCGLDRLDWDKVKYMIEFLFKDVDVEITVCNFQQMEDTPQKVSHSTRLVNHPEPLKNIDHYTIILYLSTEDGHISQEMEELDTKFNFLVSFRRSVKKFGVPIRHEIKNYILYGCIVREKLNALFDFNSFAKCLFEIDKNNRKDKYDYVALQPVYDENDDLLNEKVITLLRYCLRKVDIYICTGKTPEEQIVNNVCNTSV